MPRNLGEHSTMGDSVTGSIHWIRGPEPDTFLAFEILLAAPGTPIDEWQSVYEPGGQLVGSESAGGETLVVLARRKPFVGDQRAEWERVLLDNRIKVTQDRGGSGGGSLFVWVDASDRPTVVDLPAPIDRTIRPAPIGAEPGPVVRAAVRERGLDTVLPRTRRAT